MNDTEYLLPDDLFYDTHHSWGRREGDDLVVGLTDFAQRLAGAFIHVVLPRVGRAVSAGKPMASLESGKWVGRVYAPVSGSVTEVNEELEDHPELINSDPYGRGWVARINMSAPAELDALMRAPATRTWLAEEEARHQ
jgi:glycine cleavage system H protein